MASIGHEKSGPSAKRKFNLVLRSRDLRGSRLGGYLRAKGVYLADLRMWEEQMLNVLKGESKVTNNVRVDYEKKIKKLEKELFEAKEIIKIQKKVQEALAVEEKSTAKKPGN